LAYTYILTRLKDPSETALSEFNWTKGVVDWAVSLDAIKDRLTKIYPSTANQWEEWEGGKEDMPERFLWGQIP
jgi:acetyl-CoA carboxylase beta subunit